MSGRVEFAILAASFLLLTTPGCEDSDSPTAPLETATAPPTGTPDATATPIPASTTTPTATPRLWCYPLDVSGEYDAEWRLDDCGRSGGPTRVVLTQTDCRVMGVIPGLGTLTAFLFGTIAERSGYGIAFEPPCSGEVGGFGFRAGANPIVLPFAPGPPFPAQCPGCVPRGTLILTRIR
jgi:hypothetical protein